MNTLRISFAILVAGTLLTVSSFAQHPATSPAAASVPSDSPKSAATQSAAPTGQPSAADMQKMMELAKPGDNQKLLAGMAGNWTYTVKFWMAPSAPPTTSTGTAVRKAVMGGRYLTGEYTGKMQMPGPDGKMTNMEFKGMSTDGYDNVKKKFVGTWVDNMGTGIMNSEGTYDPATKTFTYTGEYEALPGMKTKSRMVVKIIDQDHQTFESFEDHGTGEAKTVEISYTRKK